MASAADWSAHNVRRIRPPRVLLAMRDRRFMRVTAFLLERRGYAVVQEGGSNVVDAALRSRVDVVVLEGESSRGTSAKTMAALTALPSAPSLISIVDDEAGEGLAGVPAIAKWTSVEELAREIDAVSLRR
jgi:CheY-like chemotaxis protein